MSSAAFCAGSSSDERQYSTAIRAGRLEQLELSYFTSHLRDGLWRDPVGAKEVASNSSCVLIWGLIA